MPMSDDGDPRTRLVRDKYFSLRPKPLERWLWRQRLPQAAERVFWLHWEEGMRSGDWCSQLPLKRVATLCCIDASTVTRAYQLLRSLDLIRRQDPGRDPENPFQQATAITEVRLPKQLLVELPGSPNRIQINRLQEPEAIRKVTCPPDPTPTEVRLKPTREEIQATWNRASAQERSRYFYASRGGLARIEFDPDSQLTETDRARLQEQLCQMAAARNSPQPAGKSVHVPAAAGQPRMSVHVPQRRLPTLLLARTRRRLLDMLPGGAAPAIWSQVIWAAEEGALRRFEPSLALNIALKKVREGAWTRPNRMPPNWTRMTACSETCAAA